MMITIYGIPNCNTVKKALDWLDEHGCNYKFHNFKKDGLSESKLDEWFGVFGWDKVLNKAGLTYKKLSDEQKNKIVDASSAKHFLLANTSAVKRPLVEKGGQAILLGFSTADFEKLLL